MASFEREKALALRLLKRLNIAADTVSDPNTGGPETGIDVLVCLADCRTIGIQVTEIDPHPVPGKARAEEKHAAGTDLGKVYFQWAQNDPQVMLDALARSVGRKAAIAARHSFTSIDEVWLLVCAGIPEHGAVVSTSILTPWLSAVDISQATGATLRSSKYDRCFLLPIVGAENAFYKWNKGNGWHKSVGLDDPRETPREAYVNSLTSAAAAGDWQEVDRLCAEECQLVLSEMRAGAT